jgi:hypothetical protein
LGDRSAPAPDSPIEGTVAADAGPGASRTRASTSTADRWWHGTHETGSGLMRPMPSQHGPGVGAVVLLQGDAIGGNHASSGTRLAIDTQPGGRESLCHARTDRTDRRTQVAFLNLCAAETYDKGARRARGWELRPRRAGSARDRLRTIKTT